MTGSTVLHLVASKAWGGAEMMADTLRAECERGGWNARMELPFALDERWDRSATSHVNWWRWALSSHGPADVVHAHLPWPDRAGAALVAARGRPLVVTFQLLSPAGRWPRDRCFRIQSENFLRLAGRWRSRVRWVALSRADARTLEGLLDAPVTIVRNAPPAPTSAPVGLAWPDGVTKLLSVGRLEHQKGFADMLDALSAPSLRALAWHWCVIGEGADRAALTSQIASSSLGDRVSLVGARPAIDGLVGADLVLSPSRFEGMPLVPLEAAEAGVPVLASAIDPHEELYESAPESLLPRDPREWPAVIARWITDASLRDRVRLAQRRVLGDNPRRAMFAAYESLYRELLG